MAGLGARDSRPLHLSLRLLLCHSERAAGRSELDRLSVAAADCGLRSLPAGRKIETTSRAGVVLGLAGAVAVITKGGSVGLADGVKARTSHCFVLRLCLVRLLGDVTKIWPGAIGRGRGLLPHHRCGLHSSCIWGLETTVWPNQATWNGVPSLCSAQSRLAQVSMPGIMACKARRHHDLGIALLRRAALFGFLSFCWRGLASITGLSHWRAYSSRPAPRLLPKTCCSSGSCRSGTLDPPWGAHSQPEGRSDEDLQSTRN